jgi:hypothetical protein
MVAQGGGEMTPEERAERIHELVNVPHHCVERCAQEKREIAAEIRAAVDEGKAQAYVDAAGIALNWIGPPSTRMIAERILLARAKEVLK